MKGAAIACLAFTAVALTWWLNPRFSFNLWDNFENFTVVTLHAHSLWLEGKLPILNIYQNLGTLMAGNGQSAVLYFPYTLLLLLLRAIGAPEQNLPELSALIHFPIAALGWWRLLRALDVEPEFAVVGALGIISSGCFILGNAVWQHIGVEYAWLPWLLFWVIRILRDPLPMKASLWFSLIWFLTAAGSNVQQLIYIVLNVIFFAVGIAWTDRRLTNCLKRFAIPTLSMAVLSLPSICYLITFVSSSQRAGGLTENVFLEGSVPWGSLAGLFTPFANIGTGSIFGSSSTLIFFVGIWIPLGLALVFYSRSRLGLAVLAVALLFTDFSLGANGIIYPLTRAIPVWGSFRWPFKFSVHMVSMLALAACIGLNAGWPVLRRFRRWGLFFLMLTLSLLAGRPNDTAGAVLLAVQGGLLLNWAYNGYGRVPIAFALSFISLTAALFLAFAHPSHRYQEQVGAYGADYFGMAHGLEYRLAVVDADPCQGEFCSMQPQGTFESATANGYLGLAGTVVGIAPMEFTQLISYTVWGFINRHLLGTSVASPLFQSLGVRYYLVRDTTLVNLNTLFVSKNLHSVRSRDGWTLFEDPGASQAVSVPTKVIPYQPKELSLKIFGQPGEHLAYVEGKTEVTSPPPLIVHSFNWLMGRGIRVDVENTASAISFLQISLFDYPFMEALIDGQSTSLFKTNVVASGVDVPPGRHEIVVRANAMPLLWSLIGCALVTLFGVAIIFVQSGAGSRRPTCVAREGSASPEVTQCSDP